MLMSVLSAMPTYAMTWFKLPQSLCKRIQSALTRFWWDSEPDKKKMCWVAWDKMAKPKQFGGLGFKDITMFNDALLAKLSWRILNNPNCLLARTLAGKYYHHSSFLEGSIPCLFTWLEKYKCGKRIARKTAWLGSRKWRIHKDME